MENYIKWTRKTIKRSRTLNKKQSSLIPRTVFNVCLSSRKVSFFLWFPKWGGGLLTKVKKGSWGLCLTWEGGRGGGGYFDYPPSSPGKGKGSIYGSPAKAMQLPHPWVRPSPWPSTWKQRSENIVNTFILMDGFSFTGRFIIYIQRWWCCLFGQGLGAGKTLKDDVKNIFIAGIYLKPKILRVHRKIVATGFKTTVYSKQGVLQGPEGSRPPRLLSRNLYRVQARAGSWSVLRFQTTVFLSRVLQGP